MFKYQYRFLMYYKHFQKKVIRKSQFMDILRKYEKNDSVSEWSFESSLSTKIKQLRDAKYIRFAHRKEIIDAGLKYDGRVSFLTIAEKGNEFINALDLDHDIDAYLAKFLLVKE